VYRKKRTSCNDSFGVLLGIKAAVEFRLHKKDLRLKIAVQEVGNVGKISVINWLSMT